MINVDAFVLSVAAQVASSPAREITAPKAVREALGIAHGDEVVFRVQGNHAAVAPAPDFSDLTESVSVPAGQAQRRFGRGAAENARYS